GPLAGSDVALNLVNTAPTSWGEWSARYPNTRVLSLDTGHVRDYEEGAALRLEDASEGPSYPVSVLDDRLEAKHPVLGISINGEQKAYNLARVEVTGMLRDNVGGQDILILGFGEGNGATVYDPGDVVFETFEGTGQDRELVDDEGVRWWADEELLVNQRNGRELPVIPSQVA